DFIPLNLTSRSLHRPSSAAGQRSARSALPKKRNTNTSGLPLARARRDCAIHTSNCPFWNGIDFWTAPPALIGVLVGNKIRWSGKRPKNITAKYTMPIASNRQGGGRILSFTFV